MTSLRQATAAALLLFSGATGLVYEVVWSKALADWLGNSGQAHALVLATFMGGLALGAWAFGRLADQSARPLVLYGVLELFVGIVALLFPTIQALARDGFLRVAADVPEGARLWPKLVFAAVSILAPAVAMGGTIPVMRSHTGRGPERQDPVALLYAINSLGAAAGAWLAGMVFLPNAGLWVTSRAAGGLNLLLGAAAIILGLRDRRLFIVQQQVDGLTVPPRVAKVALWAMGLSGFTTMVLETGWIRVVTLIVGGSTYAFTCIITACITGLALGSGWVAWRPPADPIRFFARAQLALVVAVGVTVPVSLRLPYLFLRARDVLSRSAEAFGLYQTLLFTVCAALVLLPTVALGAAFPIGARLASGGSASGQKLGHVWAVNTVGTVLGALLAGLWLMPQFGLSALIWLCVGVTLAVAAAFSVVAALPLRTVAAAGTLWLVLAASAPEWATVLSRLSAFRVRPAAARGKSVAEYLKADAQSASQLFIRHDTFASVFVGQSTTDASHRFLLVNGKPDASTLPMDMVTQTLIGHVGPLLAPREVKRGLVIGVGAGFTVGSVLTSPLQELDVVEISPAVVEASRFFAAQHGQALDDARVRLHIDDARTFLSLENKPYDLIVSEPSNPWVAGISSLFTDEFFALARQKLTPDGLLVQWVHTYEMSDPLVRLVLRTLLAHFPFVTAWQGGPHDVILVASNSAVGLNENELRRRISLDAVARDLRRIHIDGAFGLLSLQRAGTQSLAEYAGQGPLNTDAHNRLEYGAPQAFYTDAQASIPDDRRRPSRHRALLFSSLSTPASPTLAREVTRAVAAAQPDDDPVGRAAARAWYTRAPDSLGRLALAEFALEQGESATALQLVGAPRDEREAALAASAHQHQWRTRASVFSPLGPVSVAPLQQLRDTQALCGAVRCQAAPK